MLRESSNSTETPSEIREEESKQRPRLVIIGNGMTSCNLCENLIDLGGHQYFAITVLGEEEYPAYDRIRLAEYLQSGSSEPLIIRQSIWYEDHGIDLHLDAKVTKIDQIQRIVTDKQGKTYPYDHLVFATGTRPNIPPIPGLSTTPHATFTSIKDAKEVSRFSAQSSVAVIGGGMIGIETAEVLIKKGHKVTIFECSEFLLSKYLDQGSSSLLEQKLKEVEINCFLGVQVNFVKHNDVIEIYFTKSNEDQKLTFDELVVATGVTPRSELAAEIGLETDPSNRGIVVNELLQTRYQGIYAIGDCASFLGRSYGLLAPGLSMARTLANRLMNAPSKFESPTLYTKLKITGCEVLAVGRTSLPTDHTIYEEQDRYRRIFYNSKGAIGMISIGAWSDDHKLANFILKKSPIDDASLKLFESTGTLPLPKDDLANHDIICHCKKVSFAKFDSLISQDVSLTDAQDITGAGSVCGSCQPILDAIVGKKPNLRKRIKEVIILIAAGILVFGVWTHFPELENIESVEGFQFKLRRIFDGEYWSQITGYTTLSLFAFLGFLPTIKKKISKKSRNLKLLLVIHMGIGLLSLLTLGFHTGFQIGSGFNFILLITVLLLSFLGIFLDIIKKSLTRRSMTLRAFVQKTHGFLSYPIAFLLMVHIFLSYYF